MRGDNVTRARTNKLYHIFYIKPLGLPANFLVKTAENFEEDSTIVGKREELFPDGFSETVKVAKREKVELVIASCEFIPISTTHTAEELMNIHKAVQTSHFKDLTPVEDSLENYRLIPKTTPNVLSTFERSRINSVEDEIEAEEDEESTPVQTAGVKEENLSEVDMTTKASVHLIPMWHSHVDQQMASQELTNYISALQRAKKAGWFQNDQSLIVQSLAKSQKDHILNILPTEADSDLDTFINFLRQYYGESKDAEYESLQTLKQIQGEPVVSFLSRVVSKYWRVFHPNDAIPSFAKLESDHKLDSEKVLSILLRGLLRSSLRMALLQIRSTLTITNVADKAKEIGFALPPEINPTVGVNTVGEDKLSSEIIDQIKVCFARFEKKNNGRYEKKNNGRLKNNGNTKRKGECFYCGRKNHWANECRKRIKDVKQGKITEEKSRKVRINSD